MYAYIKGILTDYDENCITVENGGIGYMILCPLALSVDIGHVGDEVKVYLYQSVKEDDISLYGFVTKAQKDMFLKLITVNNIGPKVAHGICSNLSPDMFAAAVMSGNVAALTKVKGLGKKTAERIILELKDKLKAQTATSDAAKLVDKAGGITYKPQESSVMGDAVGALLVLGYKEQEASEAVGAAYEDGITLEELVKRSLKIAAGDKFS